MTLTRKERESLVIDLLNKCTPIRIHLTNQTPDDAACAVWA
jgi:hypothetical protein